jgi:hypothetical protein
MAKVCQLYDQPDGSINQNQAVIPSSSATLVTTTDTQTLTNKTLTSPTITNAVLTATNATLTTPTIATPTASNAVLSGTVTGTYTLAGTPTITSPAITTPTISALIATYETVAAAGNAIGNAVAIAANTVTCLVTDADGTKGAQLPVAAAGKMVFLKNADAANAILKVYPQVNSTINAIAANGSLDMAAKTSAVFFGTSATNWVTIPLLPS